jgi:hypothetical protein
MSAAMIDLQAIFRDPRWRLYRLEITAPHRMYVRKSDEGKIAALVVLRTRADGDWPLGRRALTYVADAECDRRIVEGYILLVDNKWNVVAFERACEVVKRIGNAPPTTGPWGEFYWIDATFKPTTGYRGTNDDEVPF